MPWQRWEFLPVKTGKTTVQEENIFLDHDNVEGKICKVIDHKDQNDSVFNSDA